MTIDDKLDRLLEDVAIVKTISEQHSEKLIDLEERLKPVFFHVMGVQWAVKVIGVSVGVLSCLAGILSLIHF